MIVAVLLLQIALGIEIFFLGRRGRRRIIEVPAGATLILGSGCQRDQPMAVTLHGGSMVIGAREDERPVITFPEEEETESGGP